MTEGQAKPPKPPKPARSARESPGIFSSLVGSFSEAWAELRIHKTRVLLSLIGVAVAVAALAGVVGLGAMAQQASIEVAERQSGRPATLYLSAYSNDGMPIDRDVMSEAFESIVERYRIDFASSVMYTQQRVQFLDGAVDVESRLVDVPYGTMHRVQLVEGRWFVEHDERRLAPALIVNEIFYQRLGSPDLATHPTVTLLSAGTEVTAVVAGVTKLNPYEEFPSMYMLPGSYLAIADPANLEYLQPQFELWVPPELSEQLVPLLQRDMKGALGQDATVEVFRQDYASGGEDPFGPTRLVIGGVAVLVLLLGALGLVNISLVTVRQRVREIGIRRSFGATAGRVFFAVMMESVVATVVAGVVGVLLAVLIVESPAVQDWVAFGATELPPFPVDAALLGLAAATGVGALAGLLPALVAVRVKVIDAIRY